MSFLAVLLLGFIPLPAYTMPRGDAVLLSRSYIEGATSFYYYLKVRFSVSANWTPEEECILLVEGRIAGI